MSIVILSGGTGTPKMLKGFFSLKNRIGEKIVIVANTGDDWEFYGIYVSPDVDSVIYQLKGLLDTQKMWGITNDSFNAISSLKMLKEDIWFNLGDKDLGFCLYRSFLLSQKKSLVETTNRITELLNVPFLVYPMSNDRIHTYFNTEMGRFHLEEFFIKHKNQFNIYSIDYVGADKAEVPKEVANVLEQSKLVIIGPSNPVSSIGPILYPNFRKKLKTISGKKIVISPIIGKNAVSGPTGQYMAAIGLPSTPQGIIKYYYNIADHFIFHISDNTLGLEKEFPNKKIYYKNILFTDEKVVEELILFIYSLI